MRSDILESDWKHFRQVQPLALARFCEQILSETARLSAQAGKSAHKRYLDVFQLIHDQDRELGHLFDDPRRSRAHLQIAGIATAELLTVEEIAGFSAEMQDWLKTFAVKFYDPGK